MAQQIFKVCLLGDGAVGKTAIRKQFMGEGFKEGSYTMTIGADFAVKRLKVDNSDISMQIWDLAGQVRFSAVREVYYMGAVGAILIYDITRPESYENIPNWINELIKNNKNRIVPVVLIGNKVDLRDSSPYSVPEENAIQYANSLSQWSKFDVEYIETSAKTGQNVEKSFLTLAREIKKYVSSQIK